MMVYIKKSIYEDINTFFSNGQNNEQGGIVGWVSDKNTIEYFYADQTACNTFNSYIPNVMDLNRQISIWNTKGIHFSGIIHSHLVPKTFLSETDIEYAKKILSVLDEEWLWFPLAVCMGNTIEYYFYKVWKLNKEKATIFIELYNINIV